jgi:hypothetical protein
MVTSSKKMPRAATKLTSFLDHRTPLVVKLSPTRHFMLANPAPMFRLSSHRTYYYHSASGRHDAAGSNGFSVAIDVVLSHCPLANFFPLV